MRTIRLAPLFLCPLLLSGCWFFDFVGGSAAAGTAPPITNPALAPGTLRFTGGQVTLRADVSDAGGVAAVAAGITKPDGSQETVALANTAGSTYGAGWTAPGNAAADGRGQQYAVRFRARDAAGNEATSDPLTLTVQAATTPPAGAPEF